MPDFKALQAQLQTAKQASNQAQQSLAHTKEKLKSIAREKEQLLRSQTSETESAEMNTLLQNEARLQTVLAQAKANVQETLGVVADLGVQFNPFTDPRQHISQFSDDCPILLMPMRMETRFKRVDGQAQLWVRVFPDECSVDTFEDTLSEAEIKAAKGYWETIWAAGTSTNTELADYILNQRKAAWKNLAGQLQAGRAYWITENYQPKNADDIPIRDSSDDVRFIIATENIPTEPQKSALINYWTAVYTAGGNAERLETALNTLVDAIPTTLGQELEDAKKLIAAYTPYNLATFEQPDAPSMEVVFLEFPKSETTATQSSAWSRAARVTTLPEKLVLLGYKGKDASGNPIKVVDEIGNFIPDPLIIGPDPSMDVAEVLQASLIEEFEALDATARVQKLSQFHADFKPKIQAEETQADFINRIQGLSNAALRPALKDVFNRFTEETKAAQYVNYLRERSETKWLFDFEEAVRIGMGFKVNLREEVYRQGFDKLFVVGVKLSADKTEGKAELESLFQHHHFGSTGFSILPQGTPTNNTENQDSGYSENEDHETTFERYILGQQASDPDTFFEKKDGKWLTELLGLDADKAALQLAENYYHTDQCEAKAMNRALWSATWGYFMESMLSPIFDERIVEQTRDFFTRFISGRGGIPMIRIADQPYGILPMSKLSDPKWLYKERDNILFRGQYEGLMFLLQGLHPILNTIRADFSGFLDDVAYVAKAEGDPHQNLLDVLGLHATSVEFHQRFAESVNHLYNLLLANGAFSDSEKEQIQLEYKERGLDLLRRLGFDLSLEDEVLNIPILEKIFLTDAYQLKGWGVSPEDEEAAKKIEAEKRKTFNIESYQLIDDVPLSEKDPIRAYSDDKNYIQWLLDKVRSDFDALKKETGFNDEKKPKALLYLMLRHALLLEFSNSAFHLYQQQQLATANEVRRAKVDADFVGMQTPQAALLESRYQILEQTQAEINPEFTVATHLNRLIEAEQFQLPISPTLKALAHLKDIPTARLERVFVEHLDCCTYRLDAWLMGFVQIQLHAMRYQTTFTSDSNRNQGIYLGAYSMVEDLKPDNEVLANASLSSEMQAIFNPDRQLEIVTDSSNAGYIHAPSINQAVTASVLRNAYISNANQTDEDIYAINLSSERVRMAMEIVEGMQQGQSLGALLGYQLERRLHDHPRELDIYIYELRKAFPIRANQMDETSEELDNLDSITQIDARNVVDGLRLLKHIKKTGNDTYPFGKSNLRDAGSDANIINAEVNRLKNIKDAIADVAIAESMHQVVQANFERGAATLDTYSKGGVPQAPEVVRTPRSGVSLTNRIGIHLTGVELVPASTARTIAEPRINNFLADIMPDLANIACQLSYEDRTTDTSITVDYTMEHLGLSHLDLLYMLDVESDKSLSVLDDYLLHHLHTDKNLRPDTAVEIHYTRSVSEKISLFELAPLLRNMRALILRSRPLRPSDLSLPNEVSNATDVAYHIDKTLLESAFDRYKMNFKNNTVSDGLDVVDSTEPIYALFLEGNAPIKKLDDLYPAQKAQIISNIDAYISKFIDRMRSLSEFGIQGAGFGFIYDRKAAIYTAIMEEVKAYQVRWEEKLIKFNAIINAPSTTPEERIEQLQKAERTISTSYSIPVPVEADYLTALNLKLDAFNAKKEEIDHFLEGKIGGIINNDFNNFQEFIAELDAVKANLDNFDLLGIETEDSERQIAVLAQDLVLQAYKLQIQLAKQAEKVTDLLTQHSSAEPAEQVRILTETAKTLFGEDFQIVPQFQLSETAAAELVNTYTDEDLLKYQKAEKNSLFPVDDWLYSIARVREKMAHWENLVMLCEGFKEQTLDLHPMQLPYQANDSWLGLSYPEEYAIDKDKLLYTAYLPSFVPRGFQAGLLIDEWTEVIPTKDETTGLSFQYDQPNNEPPQTMLLLTPSEFTGNWKWEDIPDILHESLDMARLRAIEPKHIDNTVYAQFLPATIAKVASYPNIMISLNYALNNNFQILND